MKRTAVINATVCIGAALAGCFAVNILLAMLCTQLEGKSR